SDSGSGMDEEVREHAFEPFFTTKPIGKGTGMGLAMVYGTVQAMHGEIALFTKLGEGTTITLTFPKASADTPEVRMSPVAAMDPRVFEAACVLLVDDEPLVLRSGGRMLHAMGCEVLSANSGREGVELFKARREAVSLAIIDLVMPDMDGVATMRELHALVPELPVLLTSGYAPDAGKIDVLIDGPRVAYLSKPYDPSALISAAAKLLPLRTRHKGKTGTE
ncbi:MAG: response regulator, partial [Myxococcales bacterium]